MAIINVGEQLKGLARAPDGPSVGRSCRTREQQQQQQAEEDEGDEGEPRDWLSRAAQLVPCLGILLALCSSFFLGSASLLVKMTTSVHGIQVAVFRASIQIVIYLALILIRRLPFRPARGELKAMTARASLSALSITCTHAALKMIPLGDLTVIKFSLPIWALIIGYLVLKEPCSLLKVLAAIVSMLGVGLIAKPDLCVYLFHLVGRGLDLESEETLQRHAMEYWQGQQQQQLAPSPGMELKQLNASLQKDVKLLEVSLDGVVGGGGGGNWSESGAGVALGSKDESKHLEGCLLALASSILLAMSIISLKLCRRTPSETIIFWLSLYSVLFGAAVLLHMGQWRMPTNHLDWLYILLNGLCGAAGQWCFTNALKVEQSGIISLTRTTDIQVAFLYSAFLLHEEIRATSIVGSVLVCSAVVAIVLPKLLSQMKEKKKEQVAPSRPSTASSSSSPSLAHFKPQGFEGKAAR